METKIFFRLGQFIQKYRLWIIAVWVVIILSCIPFVPNIIAPFKSTGFSADNSESAVTRKYMEKTLGYHTNQFVILYQNKNKFTDKAMYTKQIKQSLVKLKTFPLKSVLILPSDQNNQISKDKHTAYAVVFFKSQKPMSDALFEKFKASIKKPPNMTVLLGGERSFIENVNQQTQTDLYHADSIVAPIAVVILILVFGAVVAALIPIFLGGGCALIILTSLYFIGHLCSLSIFTLNIALLLGLCLSLDYALFIINRFRDELKNHYDIKEVIGTTLNTAGKAVFFSGLTVFISLSALLLFPVNILFSVGVGGMAAVIFAVAIAITLLPAVLCVLKGRVNALPVKLLSAETAEAAKFYHRDFWRKLAEVVVERPLLFFFSTLICLLLLGSPFLNARFGISDYNILPKHSESRQFFDIYKKKFNVNELTPILAVVTAKNGNILSKKNISKLYDLSKKLKNNPRIKQMESVVSTKPQLTKSAYIALYSAKKTTPELQELLKTTTTKHMTLISIVPKYEANSPETKKLIKQLRNINPGTELTLRLTGVPVNNMDVLNTIADFIPYALLWIMILTYLALLFLLRSIFLPLKAILMNILSLCASYGVLVFVFQEGHLHELLNFTPQGMLDISLLVIIFCALFGFSMDYEVFLLTRIQEYYAITKSNEKSIIFGIVKSSRIITSAAIIVIFICGSFMVADVLMVKAFGLGIAVAITVDAFIIRILLVPATMVLVKKWNWYLPHWLDKILPK